MGGVKKMKEIDVGFVVKCRHCNAEHEIDVNDAEDLMITGKTVIECESCNKLYTVCEDYEDGKYIYFVK